MNSKFHLKNWLILSVSLWVPIQAFAVSNDTGCQVIHWRPDHVYTIKGELNSATHIILPAPIAVNPVVGNKTLWIVESSGNHVFFKPTNKDSPDGSKTTLSIVAVNNKSYEFNLKRVPQGAPECVVIKDDLQLLDKSWSHYQTPDQQMVKVLSSTLKQQKISQQEERQKIINQQRKALNEYRGHIFTKYNWKGGNSWMNKCAIDSVYDDGRWTYIRLTNDDRGVMSIYGIVAGKQERVQYTYDAQTKIYRVAGIYLKLVLIYDKTTINITRQG